MKVGELREALEGVPDDAVVAMLDELGYQYDAKGVTVEEVEGAPTTTAWLRIEEL